MSRDAHTDQTNKFGRADKFTDRQIRQEEKQATIQTVNCANTRCSTIKFKNRQTGENAEKQKSKYGIQQTTR